MITQREVRAALESEPSLWWPMTTEELRAEPRGRGGPDIALRLSWEDWSGWFLAEIKTSSTPKSVEAGLAAAARYATNRELPLLVVPFLGRTALERCIETGVSAVDLGGNAVILVPGRLAVVRTGAPNKYPESREIKGIYRGKSSLVPRVLILKESFASVGSVREEIQARGVQISLATVSKVLKGLEEDLMIRRDPTIEVLQPDLLLDRLAEDYASDRAGPLESVEVALDPHPTSLRRLRTACDEMNIGCVASSIGRVDPVPETGPLTIYVERLDAVLKTLDLEPVVRFGTVRLLESSDPRLYFDRREEEGFYWSSPVQRYLELAAGGKREREMSRVLRERILGEVSHG
jgi:hypothetical protein